MSASLGIWEIYSSRNIAHDKAIQKLASGYICHENLAIFFTEVLCITSIMHSSFSLLFMSKCEFLAIVARI